MNELLQSIRADLTSRRLLPLLALFVVGLVGAIGYVAMSGSGSSKPPAPIAAAPVAGGLPVAVAPPNATAANSETPAGLRYQTRGSTRNPFKPLVAVPTPTLSTAGGAGGSGGSGGGKPGAPESRPGGSSGGPTTSAPAPSSPTPTRPAPAPKRDFKPRPYALYSVSAMFGLAPTNPEQQPSLTPYEDMKQFEPLPSAKVPLLVFLGVTKTGEKAFFALTVPAILRGPASCYPSATQCQAIELAAGQSEELEYVKTSGEAVTFELKLIKIAKRNASAAKTQSLRRSRAGRLALLRAGLWALR